MSASSASASAFCQVTAVIAPAVSFSTDTLPKSLRSGRTDSTSAGIWTRTLYVSAPAQP